MNGSDYVDAAVGNTMPLAFLLGSILVALGFILGFLVGKPNSRPPEFHEIRCDTVYVGPHEGEK